MCMWYVLQVSRGGLFLPLLIGRHPHGVGGGVLRELRELGRLLCGREGGGRGGAVYGTHRKLDIHSGTFSFPSPNYTIDNRDIYICIYLGKPYHSFAFSSL